MNDTRDAVGPKKAEKNKSSKDEKMTLDTALAVIEVADKRCKEAIIKYYERPSYVTISDENIITSLILKILIPTGTASLILTGGAFANVVSVGVILIPLVAGLLTLVGAGFFKATAAAILTPFKYKAYCREYEIDGLFEDMALEELHAEEAKILSETQTALDFANRELEGQGHSISFASGGGFTVRVNKPDSTSQWDRLRMELNRTQEVQQLSAPSKKPKKLTTTADMITRTLE